ncbi:YcnI family protein [Microbacterium sp. Marseille-Q6965]|uniref:YcnI family protein n=1 Tax=Microbacterium sp. Marseille-Q6965 TaxID=2965072 RepID=UPI0021B82829|nr:YcnI family protein [Microbacterium sp. Marseille-Q6965]
MNNPHIPSRRPLRRLGAGVAIGAALALGLPLAAAAHVTVAPEQASAGSYEVLTFAFSHGCEGSPTTALEIEMPDGVGAVSPTVQAGWDIAISRDEADGLPRAVTFTAEEPIANELRAAVQLQVQVSADAEGTLAFPVEQRCEDGAVSWSEIAEEGEDPHALDAPAPVVTVAAGDAADDAHAPAGNEQAGAADPDTAAPWGLALGGVGAVLGAAALATSVVALRRR